MISPRSFIYSRHPRSAPSSSPSSSSSSSPATSRQVSSYFSPSRTHTSKQHQRCHPPTATHITTDIIANKPSDDTLPRRISAPKYAYSTPPVARDNTSEHSKPSSIASPESEVIMGKRKERLEANGLAPSSPPGEATTSLSRPTTPSSPVKIPKNNSNRPSAHPQKRHGSQRRKPQNVQSPEDISPSMAALLAMTDIPRHRSQRRKRKTDKPLTVEEIIDGQQVSEKELSWSLSRSPMDVLLSPPESFIDDDVSVSDCNIGSALSIRTMSADSIPSLGDSFATEGIQSVSTPGSPSLSLRGRRPSPMRKSLEPILSPPGQADEHPLAWNPEATEDTADQTPPSDGAGEPMSLLMGQLKPLRYAFKSNLTASFRALRSAAKSFSTINFSSIPSDDLLTRSLLTIDTRVPFADERRPPVSAEIPSAEMRRYLNPTMSSRVESQLATVPPPGTFSASIQMQTYKVQRSKLGVGRNQYPRSSPQSSSQGSAPPSEPQTAHSTPPGMRQREMRENSDFIRIAVMEMAMRRRGKLDDQRPGRARWALPPRRTSPAPYEIGSNGVPARWTSISA